jgi:outer membrane protein TolC
MKRGVTFPWARTAALATTAVWLFAQPLPASAQTAPDLLVHGLPAGTASDVPLSLSIEDAVSRGLQANLGLLQQQTRERRASADRQTALSNLLPSVGGEMSAVRQKVSLAAFGFTGFPGVEFPTLIGPFNVFDARVSVGGPLLDLSAAAELSEKSAAARAETHSTAFTRQQIVFAVALLYNQSLTADSRLAAIKTQAATAEALDKLAQDQKAAGLVPGIDVVRQDLLLESVKQRVVSAGNDAEKARLRLARAIGLPLGQPFTLAGALTYTPAPPMTVDAAVALAYTQREDLKGASERSNAADASVKAATFSRLPTLRFSAAYGKIGDSVSNLLGTYSAAAVLRVPLFDGGASRARAARATAEFTARKADADDNRTGVYYEVRGALLDLDAADAAVRLAGHGRELADLQLTQARDRFTAGVASSIELSQAQEAVATASDNYFAALFAHVLAKAALARAIGTPEAELTRYLGGNR